MPDGFRPEENVLYWYKSEGSVDPGVSYMLWYNDLALFFPVEWKFPTLILCSLSIKSGCSTDDDSNDACDTGGFSSDLRFFSVIIRIFTFGSSVNPLETIRVLPSGLQPSSALLLYYEKTLLHMTHCFSFMVQQMMMPMGKMRTASATPSGG